MIRCVWGMEERTWRNERPATTGAQRRWWVFTVARLNGLDRETGLLINSCECHALLSFGKNLSQSLPTPRVPVEILEEVAHFVIRYYRVVPFKIQKLFIYFLLIISKPIAVYKQKLNVTISRIRYILLK